jgi:hypothetical protein
MVDQAKRFRGWNLGWLAARSPGTNWGKMRLYAAILRIVLNIMAAFFFLSTTAPKNKFRHAKGKESAHHGAGHLHLDVM